ncbi:MAG: helix-turn-helix domain-containing protein [Gaiellales bacterium]
MSGIGIRLREERVRRGIDIEEVEAETRIRAKYLRALEDERYDVLPGDAYVRAFLRDYAEELGLDPQQLVDELNAEHAPPEEVPLTPQRTAGPITSAWDGRRRALGIVITVVIAVGAAGAAGLALLGATHNSAGGTASTSQPPASSPPASSTPPASSPSPNSAPIRRAAALALAASGPCWVEVRAGSSSGQLLFTGMLAAGQTRHFPRVPVWIRVGAPWDLALKIRGRPMRLPITSAGNVLVTASGVTAA